MPLESGDSGIDAGCNNRRSRPIPYRLLYAVLPILLRLRISRRLFIIGDDCWCGLSWWVSMPLCFLCGMYGFGVALYCTAEFFDGPTDCTQFQPQSDKSHSGDTVTQKLLTMPYYCNTLIAIGRAHMANVLSIDKQVAIISALAEGSGIRQIERITGVHRDTIMWLGVRVGQGCADLLDSKMRNLSCQHLQFDEVWGFHRKEAKARPA